jgi:hypothetical protein
MRWETKLLNAKEKYIHESETFDSGQRLRTGSSKAVVV